MDNNYLCRGKLKIYVLQNFVQYTNCVKQEYISVKLAFSCFKK